MNERMPLARFVVRHQDHGGDLTVTVDATGDDMKWACRCPCGESWVGDGPGLLGELGKVQRA